MNLLYMKEIVSVAVISYNASSTVVETLDSILKQDYGSQYIELVIADDHSLDDTCAVVGQWLELHGNAFNNVEFIINEQNNGVTKNYNMACQRCSSLWIKPIAADDILLDTCITDNMDYKQHNPQAQCIFSLSQCFNQSGLLAVIPNRTRAGLFGFNANYQYHYLLLDNFVSAPSAFICKDLLSTIDFADERFSLFEDYPLWLRITRAGVKLDLMSKITVMYRLGESASVSSSRIYNLKLSAQMDKVRVNYVSQMNVLFWVVLKLDMLICAVQKKVIITVFDNKPSMPANAVYKVFQYLKPSTVVKLVVRLFN